MGTENFTSDKVLIMLLKEPFVVHTATSLAKSVGLTRQGVWKILHKLSKNKLIILESIGKNKTSISTIKLNWDNFVTEKTLSLLLTKESLKEQRWIVNFKELCNNVEFLIIFGSILINPKESNDIDIIAVVKKKNFKKVEEIISKIQKTQFKKIHLIDLTKTEFIYEIKEANKAYVDALKKGIILYGQDEFIKLMKVLQNEIRRY